MKYKYTNEKLFKQTKDNILSRADLSKKGSVDIEIKEIVDLINSCPDYCTTSSCSGRITLLERTSNKKFETNWLISSHQPVTLEQIKEKLVSDKEVWLMQESFILHIFCRTIEKAESLLKCCREVGFKHSGIISVTNKIMVEIMGNEKVETVIIKEGKNYVNDDYLKILIDSCNERMLSNRAKLDVFLNELKTNKKSALE